MLQEYLFRFFTVRSGNLQKKSERADKKIPVYHPRRPTELGQQLERIAQAGGSAEQMLRLIVAFQNSAAHVKRLRDLPFDVQRGLDWIAELAFDRIEDLDLPGELQTLYGRSAHDLLNSPEYGTTLDRVSDTIVAEAMRPTWQDPTDPLASARKLLELIRWVADNSEFGDDRLGATLAAYTISIPPYVALPRKPAPSEPSRPAPDPRVAEADALRTRIRNLEAAHRELSRTVVDEGALVSHRAPRAEAAVSRPGRVERRSRAAAGRPQPASSASPEPVFSGAALRFTSAAVSGLSDTSRGVLADLKIEATRRAPTAMVSMIEEEMQVVSGQLASMQPASNVVLLGGVMLDVSRLHDTILAGHGGPEPVLLDRCNFQAGVGDLLLVKQTLKAYELAEFAHVENVLAGETREREHRRLNLREETTTIEEERETEKERDLQSTERNEMQSEAEKTVKSQFQLEAGLQVSGSYGPAVSFSASLNTGFSTSTEETQRKAVTYSREVTDKTSERVRERVRQEIRRRVLEQVEEINRHSITNVPATNGHVRGIYRWLNKVYDAQILNYGQRMMFEFVVPEPAAYLLYALIENPPPEKVLVKPEPPMYFGAPLKPSHLNRWTYLDFVAKYQVRNVPPPPPEFQHVAVFDKQDKVEGGSMFGRGTKVEIPAGYEAFSATVMTDYTFTKDAESHPYHVMVGGTEFDATTYWGAVTRSLDNRYKEVAIAYKLNNAWGFALGIDVHCRLAADGLAKWQQAVFDSIIEAYLVQKATYEEKIAAAEIQQGVKILGRNPLENRRIEREELKKLVLMMLTHDNNIARNSLLPGAEPNIDLQRACVNGSWIRFFENAFEWNNILYVLYPYFWGRKSRWISALHFTDPDPDFAAFLKAGAARVQVPVRPGFEKAVAYFCQFYEVWEGNDPPLRDDALYVPIVDEIAENLGKLDEGVPYPEGSEPWEVRIPTSLVLVQNLEEIPGIRDVLTGNDVVITNT